MFDAVLQKKGDITFQNKCERRKTKIIRDPFLFLLEQNYK
jgi:hypothetical protein